MLVTPADGSYELVLLEKKDGVENGDIVPGYKRVSSITSGKKYLISYNRKRQQTENHREECFLW